MKCVKGMKLLTGIMSLMLIMGGAPAMVGATVPTTVSYQCDLASTIDSEVTAITMTFYIYSGSEPNLLTEWEETIDNIPVVNGVVSTVLGNGTPIEEEDLDDATLLGVRIADGPVMSPKSELTSSVFAMRAAVADQLAQGAIMFTDSNLTPGIVGSNALGDNAVTTDKIADGGITVDDIGDGQVTSEKMSVNVTTYTAVGSTPETYTAADQGLILASGNVTINLPHPADANGQKFTIKKIDNGLQRKCGDSCDIETKIVTVQCGTQPSDWFRGSKLIENRTYKLTLMYKNAHVSLVSNGEFWYVTDSNPPIDILNPIPGNNGFISDVNLENPVTLTWTAATDNKIRSDEVCTKPLYYMPVFSKSASDKLKTLEDVIETGFKCQSNWSQDVTSLVCNTETSDENYTGTFRVNVVVRDESGNMSVYCPPGDNEAPKVDSQYITYSTFYDQTHGQIIYLQWDIATSDNKDPVEDLKYSVYYSTHASSCLSGLDLDEPPIVDAQCNNVEIISKQQPSEIWGPTRGDTLHYKDNDAEEIVVDLRHLDALTTYYFTVVVEDKAENKKQYAIHSTTTESNP